MIDLFKQWKESFNPEPYSHPKDSDPNFQLDRRVQQKSVTFTPDTCVVLIRDPDDLSEIPAREIPKLILEAKDTAIWQERADELTQNDRQLLLKGCLFDKAKQTLYIQLVEADYAFLNCLLGQKFPESSPVYSSNFAKTGVLVPCIDEMANTFAFQRTAEKRKGLNLSSGLRSVAGGFLEPCPDGHDTNILEYNASKELTEEVTGNPDGTPRKDVNVTLQLAGLSMRCYSHTSEGKLPPLPTFEFIYAAFVRHKAAGGFAQNVLDQCTAKDCGEHEKNENPDGSYSLERITTNLTADPMVAADHLRGYPGAFLSIPSYTAAAAAYKARQQCEPVAARTAPKSLLSSTNLPTKETANAHHLQSATPSLK